MTKLNKTYYIPYCYTLFSRRKISFSTLKWYNELIKNHMEEFFEGVLIDDLNIDLILDFVDTIRVDRVLIILRITLRRLFKTRRIKEDLWAYVERPGNLRNKKEPKEALTKEQLRMLFNYYRGHRLEHAIHLMFKTGIRRGEALALQWDEIEFINAFEGFIHVNSSYGITEDGWGRKEPKTPSSRRKVYFYDQTLVTLLKRAYRASIGKLWVIENSTGEKPILPNNFSRRFFGDVGKELGFYLCSHHARVQYISSLVAKGVPMTLIEEQVGHANSEMIIKVYAKNITKASRFLHGVPVLDS